MSDLFGRIWGACWELFGALWARGLVWQAMLPESNLMIEFLKQSSLKRFRRHISDPLTELLFKDPLMKLFFQDLLKELLLNTTPKELF